MILSTQTVLRCAAYTEEEKKYNNPADKTWYMAFSMTPEDRRFTRLKTASDSERVLLSDRKRWLEHLTASALAKSVSLQLLFPVKDPSHSAVKFDLSIIFSRQCA